MSNRFILLSLAVVMSLVSPAKTSTSPRVLSMQVTAYCGCPKCCGKHAHGVTASGKPVTYNNGMFVAADTKVLPFGTKLIIPGYSEDKAVEVIDRGGAIKGNRLDVFFMNHEDARKWGRQNVDVTIVE